MAIQVTVPIELLDDPGVAGALTQLLGALGRPEAPALLARVFGRIAPEALPVPTATPAPTPAPARRGSRQLSFDEFVAGLPPRSQLFIDLVRERGAVTVTDVVEALGLSSPKAVGGITGAIGRWGPARGIELPYEPCTLSGERGWRWLGNGDGDRPPPAAAPRSAGRGKGKGKAGKGKAGGRTARASAPAAVIAEPAGPITLASCKPEVAERFMAALPETGRRFLDLLRERLRLTTSEVLGHLGLARAGFLTPHLQAIVATAEKHGIEQAFVRSSTPTGEPLYLWPGTSETRVEATSEPAARVLPFSTGETPAPRSDLTAGVGVRRRRARG